MTSPRNPISRSLSSPRARHSGPSWASALLIFSARSVPSSAWCPAEDLSAAVGPVINTFAQV